MKIPLRKKPWPVGAHPYQACSVCGKPWRPWAGSVLPCHAACLFTEAEEEAIAIDQRTMREIAAELGVTTSIIRSVSVRARKRVQVLQLQGRLRR